jgi:hypothetical protein
MKFRSILFAGLAAIAFASCEKTVDNVKDRFGANAPSAAVVEHFIAKGAHSSDKNSYRPVNTSEMKFTVRFDSSAIYQTVTPVNQLDINKLYGFADNNQEHHLNSARIGWRWYNNALQLFAYVYNDGVEKDKMITAVPLGQDISCSIKVSGNQYILTANGVQATMSRTATTETAIGYQLYPYFGGDEVAPQDIRIRITDL